MDLTLVTPVKNSKEIHDINQILKVDIHLMNQGHVVSITAGMKKTFGNAWSIWCCFP